MLSKQEKGQLAGNMIAGWAVALSVKNDCSVLLFHSLIFFPALFMLSDPWVRAQGGNYRTSAKRLLTEFVEMYPAKWN